MKPGEIILQNKRSTEAQISLIIQNFLKDNYVALKSINVQVLDHYVSDQGRKVKDCSVVTTYIEVEML